uniref:exodeoxyribonuclease III n=1 Tax=Podarcis muralis TaxID=64176 RepID=A0A670J780_PODMU
MPKRGKKKEGEALPEEKETVAEPEPKKAKKGGAKAEKEADGPILYQDPPDKLTSPSGKKYTLKVTSWNVDGIRAWFKKKGLEWVCEEKPDILCLQETKCAEKQLPAEIRDLADYPHKYWACSDDKEGYSGVALLSKAKPVDVTYGIGEEEHDKEGRVITAEFPSYFLVTAYVPQCRPGPGATGVPPALGRGLPLLPARPGCPQAPRPLRGPQRGPPGDRPEEPQGQQEERRLHPRGAGGFRQAAGGRLCRHVPPPLPRHPLRLHLLDLHDERPGQERGLAARLLCGLQRPAGERLRQQDPIHGLGERPLPHHPVPGCVMESQGDGGRLLTWVL